MDLGAYLTKIRREIEQSSFRPYADILHTKTGISPEVFLILLGVIISFMLFFDIYPEIICDIIALSYPLYSSIKVIELKDRTNEMQW